MKLQSIRRPKVQQKKLAKKTSQNLQRRAAIAMKQMMPAMKPARTLATMEMGKRRRIRKAKRIKRKEKIVTMNRGLKTLRTTAQSSSTKKVKRRASTPTLIKRGNI